VQVNYLRVTAITGTTFVVDDKFEYIKQIGHGAYGVVCSAYDHKSKNKVAIKKVPKAFEDLIDAKRIVREIKLLSKSSEMKYESYRVL
jgi:mitogen-activated protein kinase 1/3